ncbi:MAG: isopenicillin N synthase family oxygenase [Anaerolineales bacterium]|nr:isopenicillin N synthase family oxygenase [Anaerolineales bacterium]
MPLTHVPTIDLIPFRSGPAEAQARVAADVAEACEAIGFLTIVGHGVPPAVLARASDAARAFFDQPAAEKRALGLTPTGIGYSPLHGERLAATLGQVTPPDLKESLNLSADFAANLWPREPAVLRPALEEYFRAMSALAAELLQVFATALTLPRDYFADKINRAASFLRVINYPAPAAPPEPGQLRAGAHTDYGTLTILRAENVAGGLQVQTRAGEWVDVAVPPEAFVVNLGDMLMRWTNDRWRSTLHRVVNPPLSAGAVSRRQSLAFFHNPNPEALIECLPNCCDAAHPARYAPITAGAFIAEKAARAYGTKP